MSGRVARRRGRLCGQVGKWAWGVARATGHRAACFWELFPIRPSGAAREAARALGPRARHGRMVRRCGAARRARRALGRWVGGCGGSDGARRGSRKPIGRRQGGAPSAPSAAGSVAPRRQARQAPRARPSAAGGRQRGARGAAERGPRGRVSFWEGTARRRLVPNDGGNATPAPKGAPRAAALSHRAQRPRTGCSKRVPSGRTRPCTRCGAGARGGGVPAAAAPASPPAALHVLSLARARTCRYFRHGNAAAMEAMESARTTISSARYAPCTVTAKSARRVVASVPGGRTVTKRRKSSCDRARCPAFPAGLRRVAGPRGRARTTQVGEVARHPGAGAARARRRRVSTHAVVRRPCWGALPSCRDVRAPTAAPRRRARDVRAASSRAQLPRHAPQGPLGACARRGGAATS